MLKGTDMSLFAVFVKLDLDVRVKPILTDMASMSARYMEFGYPYEGHHAPGIVSKTDLITSEHEDAMEILTSFGQPLHGVNWVTKPLWKNLALVHGNVSISSSYSLSPQ